MFSCKNQVLERIEVAGLCTACHLEDWFSYRAEKRQDRSIRCFDGDAGIGFGKARGVKSNHERTSFFHP